MQIVFFSCQKIVSTLLSMDHCADDNGANPCGEDNTSGNYQRYEISKEVLDLFPSLKSNLIYSYLPTDTPASPHPNTDYLDQKIREHITLISSVNPSTTPIITEAQELEVSAAFKERSDLDTTSKHPTSWFPSSRINYVLGYPIIAATNAIRRLFKKGKAGISFLIVTSFPVGESISSSPIGTPAHPKPGRMNNITDLPTELAHTASVVEAVMKDCVPEISGHFGWIDMNDNARHSTEETDLNDLDQKERAKYTFPIIEALSPLVMVVHQATLRYWTVGEGTLPRWIRSKSRSSVDGGRKDENEGNIVAGMSEENKDFEWSWCLKELAGTEGGGWRRLSTVEKDNYLLERVKDIGDESFNEFKTPGIFIDSFRGRRSIIIYFVPHPSSINIRNYDSSHNAAVAKSLLRPLVNIRKLVGLEPKLAINSILKSRLDSPVPVTPLTPSPSSLTTSTLSIPSFTIKENLHHLSPLIYLPNSNYYFVPKGSSPIKVLPNLRTVEFDTGVAIDPKYLSSDLIRYLTQVGVDINAPPKRGRTLPDSHIRDVLALASADNVWKYELIEKKMVAGMASDEEKLEYDLSLKSTRWCNQFRDEKLEVGESEPEDVFTRLAAVIRKKLSMKIRKMNEESNSYAANSYKGGKKRKIRDEFSREPIHLAWNHFGSTSSTNPNKDRVVYGVWTSPPKASTSNNEFRINYYTGEDYGVGERKPHHRFTVHSTRCEREYCREDQDQIYCNTSCRIGCQVRCHGENCLILYLDYLPSLLAQVGLDRFEAIKEVWIEVFNNTGDSNIASIYKERFDMVRIHFLRQKQQELELARNEKQHTEQFNSNSDTPTPNSTSLTQQQHDPAKLFNLYKERIDWNEDQRGWRKVRTVDREVDIDVDTTGSWDAVVSTNNPATILNWREELDLMEEVLKERKKKRRLEELVYILIDEEREGMWYDCEDQAEVIESSEPWEEEIEEGREEKKCRWSDGDRMGLDEELEFDDSIDGSEFEYSDGEEDFEIEGMK